MNLRHLKGHTDRIVVNHSPLHDNKNWLFDVVFDFRAFELQTHHIAIPVEGQGKSRLTARNDKGKVTRRDHAILTHPGE